MRGNASEQSGAVGHDSFLDVVTNMVGILIVLVMVVGMRIKNAPVEWAPSGQMQEAAASLEKEQARERSLHQDIAETTARIESVAAETALRSGQRDVLATLASALEHKLRSGREELDAARKEEFDLRRTVAEAQADLQRLQEQRTRLETGPHEPVVVPSYPTPLGKVVLGDEVHFHLRGGRVACVPVEKLVLLARDDARRKADKLLGGEAVSEFTETVGPENGFRFRYTVQRYEEVERTPSGLVRHYGMRLAHWTVIPVAGELGETVGEALGPDSQFRRALVGLAPDKCVVTIWVYADSFDGFRQLRQELYRLGFRVAARPLPEGVLIAGSPKGSKSEAE